MMDIASSNSNTITSELPYRSQTLGNDRYLVLVYNTGLQYQRCVHIAVIVNNTMTQIFKQMYVTPDNSGHNNPLRDPVNNTECTINYDTSTKTVSFTATGVVGSTDYLILILKF